MCADNGMLFEFHLNPCARIGLYKQSSHMVIAKPFLDFFFFIGFPLMDNNVQLWSSIYCWGCYCLRVE